MPANPAVSAGIPSNLRPHLRDVAGDLFAQFRRRGEFLFVAQLPAKFNFQFLAVKIAGKIQQMRLHAKLRPGRSTVGRKPMLSATRYKRSLSFVLPE